MGQAPFRFFGVIVPQRRKLGKENGFPGDSALLDDRRAVPLSSFPILDLVPFSLYNNNKFLHSFQNCKTKEPSLCPQQICNTAILFVISLCLCLFCFQLFPPKRAVLNNRFSLLLNEESLSIADFNPDFIDTSASFPSLQENNRLLLICDSLQNLKQCTLYVRLGRNNQNTTTFSPVSMILDLKDGGSAAFSRQELLLLDRETVGPIDDYSLVQFDIFLYWNDHSSINKQSYAYIGDV